VCVCVCVYVCGEQAVAGGGKLDARLSIGGLCCVCVYECVCVCVCVWVCSCTCANTCDRGTGTVILERMEQSK
jgi:hypothetical protein